MLTAAAGQAAAQATTYNFTGGLYDVVNNNTTCTVGDCATYTTAQQPTASITFAAPLAANLTNVDVSAQVTSFTFNDGGGTPVTTGPGATGSIHLLLVSTNGAGALIGYNFVLERTPGPPYSVGSFVDPNSRISLLQIGSLGSSTQANLVCTVRAPNAAGSSAGNCAAGAVDTNVSNSSSSAPSTFTVTSLATVPTLSEWAMILFVLLLIGGAVVNIQRRRTA